jgi:Calcineurin-like phosphoesterase
MRNRIALLLTATLLAGSFLALAAPQAVAAITPLNPVADSYVQADLPTSNFGTAAALKVDGSPATVSYLKFDVQGITGAPAKATLKVFVPVSTSTPINVRSVADSTWTETGLTYNNRPATGATAIASPVPIAANTTLSFDVTSLVAGAGPVSFALDTTSSTSKSLPSREATADQPQLVIEADSTPPPAGDAVMMAVGGDVACGTTEANYNGGAGTATACHMKQTSDLVVAMGPRQVWALGDLQYNSGSLADFNVSYQNSWGRFKSITRPVVGNHEYGSSGANGYFTYFGDLASPRQPGCTQDCEGYYSFDVPVGSAQWHVAVINSECTRIGGGVGCAVGSPQHQWLDADLRAHAEAQCTAVLTHRPRWASNSFASPDIQPLVDIMYSRGVDLLLAGHAHSYERFAPQNAAGQPDPAGITEFAVGTGGRDSQGFGTVVANSQVRKNQIFGVMKLALRPTGYDWQFVPDPATPFADSGTGTCH